MKSKTPAEMSNEELLKAVKTSQTATYVLAGMLIVLFLVNVFLTKKNIWGVIALPLCFTPLLLISVNGLKELKKERASRNI